VNPDVCKGLPALVNGLEYDPIKTTEYVQNQTQTDYKTFLDGTCKPSYVVSTTHLSSYTLKGSFLLMTNPEQLANLVQKWVKWVEPISKEMFSSSLVGLRSNINPFTPYYGQLKMYKTALENKKDMVSKLLTADTEILASVDNIKDTLQAIRMKYAYFSDLPFNMKEYLGFEKIGGWLGSAAARDQVMKEIDGEVKKLNEPVSGQASGLERINAEKKTKIDASKAVVVLTTFVLCYLNEMEDTGLEKILGVLNTLYEQINRFSDAKGTPEELLKFVEAYVTDFPKHLDELKAAMGPGQKGGAWLGKFKGKATDFVTKIDTTMKEQKPFQKAKSLLLQGAEKIAGMPPVPKHGHAKLDETKLTPRGGVRVSASGPSSSLDNLIEDGDNDFINGLDPAENINEKHVQQLSSEDVAGGAPDIALENIESENPKGPKNKNKIRAVAVSSTEDTLESLAAASQNDGDVVAAGSGSAQPSTPSVPGNEKQAEGPDPKVNQDKIQEQGVLKTILGLYQSTNPEKPEQVPFETALNAFYQEIKNTDVKTVKMDDVYNLIPQLEGNEKIDFNQLKSFIEGVLPTVPAKMEKGMENAKEETTEKANPLAGTAAEPSEETKGETKEEQARQTGGAVTDPNKVSKEFRAKLHYFMKPLYFLVKTLQKDIDRKENTVVSQTPATVDEPIKNRLSSFKEYLKTSVRGQGLISFHPKEVSDYPFIRVYNSTEHKYAKLLFELTPMELGDTFENTAYQQNRGFVFVKDPNYFGSSYSYDVSDLTKATDLPKPNLDIQPKRSMFAMFQGTKAPKAPKQAYGPTKFQKRMDAAATGATAFATEAAATVGQVPMTQASGYLLKSGKYAGEMTGTAIGTTGTDAGKYIASMAPTIPVPSINVVTPAKEFVGASIPQAVKNRLKGGGAVPVPLRVVGGIIGGAFGLVLYPVELSIRLAIATTAASLIPLKMVGSAFKDTFSPDSYKQGESVANTKITECGKIATLLRSNWRQMEENQHPQNVLQVLANVYSAIDYIEKAETSFRDMHQYEGTEFKKRIEALVSRIREPTFKDSKLFQSMNEPKKLLYMVYSILQKCSPTKLTEARDVLLGKTKPKTDEFQPKIDSLLAQLTALEADKAKTEKVPEDKANADQSFAAKKKELETQIQTLEENRKSVQELDSELKEEPAALDQNEKLVKEMLKKTPTITFDLTEMENVFNNPKTYVVKRYSTDPKRQLTSRLDLMPEVSILAPKNPPALASLFVYRTDVDPEQAEKNKAAEKKAEEAKATKERRAVDSRLRANKYESKKAIRQQQQFELQKKRIETRRYTDDTRRYTDAEKIRSSGLVKATQMDVNGRLREAREKHRAAVEEVRLKEKMENRRFSAQVAEAKRKEGSTKEVERIQAEKKLADAAHQSEINKLNEKFNQVLGNIKPGAQVNANVTRNNRNAANANKNVTQSNRGTKNGTKNEKGTNNAKKANGAKIGSKKQTVCLNLSKGKRCYNVNTADGTIQVTPVTTQA
jgi:hypothetical protein